MTPWLSSVAFIRGFHPSSSLAFIRGHPRPSAVAVRSAAQFAKIASAAFGGVMRKQIAHIVFAVATAAVAAACGAGDAGAKGSTPDGRDRGNPQRVKLNGCVQAAPGYRRYILQDVVTPGTAEQPTGNDARSQALVVPDGSWVRLARGAGDLEQYLGKRVEIEGVVADTGEPTIGTTGGVDDRTKLRRSAPDASSTTDRSLPPSTAAPYGANANGTAPQITVERISTLADSCADEHERLKEGNTGLGRRRRAPKEDDPAAGSHR
jgi:hypothetical protein